MLPLLLLLSLPRLQLPVGALQSKNRRVDAVINDDDDDVVDDVDDIVEGVAKDEHEVKMDVGDDVDEGVDEAVASAAAAAAAATADDLEAMRESMENAEAFRLKVDEALEADTDRDAAEVVKGCFGFSNSSTTFTTSLKLALRRRIKNETVSDITSWEQGCGSGGF